MRYVLIPKFCADSGYTEKAVRRKIEEGVWIAGQHWVKAPDGHVLIDVEGFEQWAAGQQARSNPSKGRSGSNSPSMGRAA